MSGSFNLFEMGMEYLKGEVPHGPPAPAPVTKPQPLRLGAVLEQDSKAVQKVRQAEDDAEARKGLDQLRGRLGALQVQQRVGGAEILVLLGLGAAGYGLCRLLGAGRAGRTVSKVGRKALGGF